MKITDLKTAMDYIKAHREQTHVIVSKRVFARIRRQIAARSPIREGPRPPDGDPDQWLWDQRRRVMALAHVYVLGTRVMTRGDVMRDRA
jgi:hypothetical protein